MLLGWKLTAFERDVTNNRKSYWPTILLYCYSFPICLILYWLRLWGDRNRGWKGYLLNQNGVDVEKDPISFPTNSFYVGFTFEGAKIEAGEDTCWIKMASTWRKILFLSYQIHFTLASLLRWPKSRLKRILVESKWRRCGERSDFFLIELILRWLRFWTDRKWGWKHTRWIKMASRMSKLWLGSIGSKIDRLWYVVCEGNSEKDMLIGKGN